jgi:hypothetical protein
MIEGGVGVTRTIDLGSVQAFVTKANHEIKSRGFKAAIGSASLKWSCNCGHWCVGNWWANTGVSFHVIHYYSWMATGGNTYDPFSTKPSDWCLPNDGTEYLIGESPSENSQYLGGTLSVADQFYKAHELGWSGVMPWADSST